MWYMGKTERTQSRVSNRPFVFCVCKTQLVMLKAERATPFALPVVPDEKGK